MPGNADAYEALLRSEIFPGIVARKIAGFHRIELLRRPLAAEVEFVTIMWFSSLAAVKDFAGDRYEQAVVPGAARALLARFDECSHITRIREARDAVCKREPCPRYRGIGERISHNG